MGEDGLLEVCAARLRVRFLNCFDEGFSGTPVGLQRVGLAAAPIEREHELRMQALASRMLFR